MRVAEIATHRQYKTDLEAVFMPIISHHGGRIVKTTGDGLLAEFSSVVDCVGCAVEIQKSFNAQRQDPSDANALVYRIGINVGDIIAEANDIYGDSVNIAARLQSFAKPGGIALSGEAYRHIVGKLDAAVEDFGERQIKNISEPLHVYRINLAPGEGSPAQAGLRPGSTLAVTPSIIVLPFEMIGNAGENRYFADGITNDIIACLSRFSELFVIASHTSFSYRDRPIGTAELGRELNVRYALKGSIQHAADKIRVSVQLIETASSRQLWADRYERPQQELFQLQDEIVETIVGTLVTRLDRSEHRRILYKEPTDLKTYDWYLRGRAAWREWTSDSNERAQMYFNRTIELDPAFAPAYAYLSYTLMQAWISGWDSSSEAINQARTLARKAVTLEPENFENHWCLASAYLYGGEYEAAMLTYEKALHMNPNSPGLLVDMADALIFGGRPREAIDHAERAMRMDPVSSDAHLWTLAIALYHAGDCERALTTLLRMANPPTPAKRHLAAIYVQLGNLEKARETAAEFLHEEPQYTLKRERIWPYQDGAMLEKFISDLRSAGLPEG
jgi:adenylate cyclase